MNTIKVGMIQVKNEENISLNLEKLWKNIEKASQMGAQLVVLQELHNSLYFCQEEAVVHFDLAETIPGKSTDFFGKLAKKLGLVLVLSLFEKRAKGLYHNTAVVLEKDGTIAGKYRKMHIPDDPGFYEKFYFTPGDLGFNPIQTSLGKLGVLVCWDQWYPEAARLMALAGAELLIYPTAIGFDPLDTRDEQLRQQNAWSMIQRSHAIANGIPVVSVNRIGRENAIDFWGHSFICGPQGEIIEQLGDCEEQVSVVDVPLDKTEAVRRIWPFLRDRRIDCYENILKRYND
jgi:N-carbamoylputrescine amidase